MTAGAMMKVRNKTNSAGVRFLSDACLILKPDYEIHHNVHHRFDAPARMGATGYFPE